MHGARASTSSPRRRRRKRAQQSNSSHPISTRRKRQPGPHTTTTREHTLTSSNKHTQTRNNGTRAHGEADTANTQRCTTKQQQQSRERQTCAGAADTHAGRAGTRTAPACTQLACRRAPATATGRAALGGTQLLAAIRAEAPSCLLPFVQRCPVACCHLCRGAQLLTCARLSKRAILGAADAGARARSNPMRSRAACVAQQSELEVGWPSSSSGVAGDHESAAQAPSIAIASSCSCLQDRSASAMR